MANQSGQGLRSICIDRWLGWAPLACLVTACSAAEAPTTEPVQKRTDALVPAADTVRGESASPTAIVVNWDTKSSEQSSATLAARIQNTTTKELVVTLTLESTSPTGDIVSRPVATQRVAAGGNVAVSYSAADVPVRSVGLASTLRLLAAYQVPSESFGPNGVTGGTRTQTVFTPLLHATFDGKGAATFRDADAQVRVNGLDTRSPFTKLTSVSVYDHASGAIVDVTAEAKRIVDGQSKPLLLIRKGAAPGGRAQAAGGGQSP